MTKSRQILLKIILVPLIIVTIHLMFNYHRITIDGERAEIFSFMLGEDTRYSDKFTHYNFTKIKLGMTEQQVLALLGQPLSKFAYHWVDNKTFNSGRFIGLKYSDSPTSDNYRLRIIHLDKGVVVRVMGEFYFD